MAGIQRRGKTDREKKVSQYKRKKTAGRDYSKTSDKSKFPKIDEVSYHPESIAYMKEKSGGKLPKPSEAVKLDEEWATKKLSGTPSRDALRLVMGDASLHGSSGSKRSLAGRQFKDIVDTGKADLEVTEPIYDVKPLRLPTMRPKKKDDDDKKAV